MRTIQRVFFMMMLFSVAAIAQQADLAKQKEAMAKLNFLIGKWQGPASISRGPGGPLKITQTEEIEYKLDGLVMQVHGTGRNDSGKVLFEALATVAYDEATSTYRIRAYNDGHYVDAELKVMEKGFEWGFGGGGYAVVNAMHVSDKGEWAETTMVTVGQRPPMKSVEMLLEHLK